jgi:hypothetical protein
VSRAVARFVGLLTLWAGVELLERVAYRAGVDDAELIADNTLRAYGLPGVDEDLADEQRRRLCLGDCCQAST